MEMASRLKEDEKNEKIIRSLLKLPANRRCINCNSLGPQYVCTNFWTFVCTTCSGIHREFTHRVKSISMAKFTSQEVSALQEGGNERAKEIYFKEWDPQRASPDSSNVEKLRDFIKHVYVDRRFSGDKPPRVKMGDKDDPYRGASRSPPYEDTYGRRYDDRPSPGGRSDDRNSRYNDASYDERRSPGYGQDNQQYSDYRKSPVRPDIVNDWRREDRFGTNERKFEDRRMSEGDSKVEGKSPSRSKDLDMFSPPVVRPVRDILGDNVPPIRIAEPPKANSGRATQRTASSSSLGSSSENPAEDKKETSLIDFDADTIPPVNPAVLQTQPATTSPSVGQPTNTSSNDQNWASFDFGTEIKVSQPSSNVNSLESVLSQLSVPASVPAAQTPLLPSSGASPVVSLGQISVSPFSGGTPAAATVSSFSPVPPSGAGQWPGMPHQQPSLFPATGGPSTAQYFTSVSGASSNQMWNSSLAANTQGPLSNIAAAQPYQAVTTSHQVSAGIVPQPSPFQGEPISSGRKELPADLFAATYSPASYLVPGMLAGRPPAYGYAMQFNSAMPMPVLQQASKSTNPFDLNSSPSAVQAPTFPSMMPLQAALPNMQGAIPNMLPATGILRTSSLGNASPAWMPQQSSSYPSAMPPQPPPYASAMHPSAYMGQQVANSMPNPGQQGMVGAFGSEGAGFSTQNPGQQPDRRYSAPATPNSFSSAGGNPFG